MAHVESSDVKETRMRVAGIEVPVSIVPRLAKEGYRGRFSTGLRGLLSGMRLTLGYFFGPVITQQYPENRKTLKFPERYRAILKLKFVPMKEAITSWDFKRRDEGLPKVDAHTLRTWLRGYEEVKYHKCTGCGNCEKACPNGSIKVITRYGEITEDRELDRFIWRMDSCMFCNACVQACPHDALEMGPEFENAVYDRRLLIYNLNTQAGAAARFVVEEEAEMRRKMMAPREVCGGPIPLNGHYLPRVEPLQVVPLLDGPAPENAVAEVAL
ncbi:MAG: 4Fe-4S binding protein [Candidatus Hydrogenedentes bacterium]|nr:4Fe-4S binding protein [Candidatus Hydrogenedentota bacterium]